MHVQLTGKVSSVFCFFSGRIIRKSILGVYDHYVKKKSYKLCKRKFHCKYHGVHVPAPSHFLKLVKKVH
jgi:hypothetical protein